MNPLLKLPKVSLNSFFLGVASGFSAALILPEFGEAYYKLSLVQAERLKAVFAGASWNVWLTLTIYLRNVAIALLLAIIPLALVYHAIAYRKRYPFKSGDFSQKLIDEIRLTLTLYSISTLFAYGFVVFGLFLAFVFVENSFSGLIRWTLYLMPHGVLETFSMISAASTGIIIREKWLRDFDVRSFSFWKQIPRRDYVTYLLWLSIVLFISALLEVYVSTGLMQLV